MTESSMSFGFLGELLDAGNTTTLAHNVDLLFGAGLLIGLQKFSKQAVGKKASIPKFAVFNTALRCLNRLLLNVSKGVFLDGNYPIIKEKK
ncbi:MAG: hypothetical protein LLG04_02780 [Parachlamydia sp.]|nr:hypothetical protein [Parachlamydia sp.]